MINQAAGILSPKDHLLNEVKGPFNFEGLPLDIQKVVLEKLSPKEMQNAASVSKDMKAKVVSTAAKEQRITAYKALIEMVEEGVDSEKYKDVIDDLKKIVNEKISVITRGKETPKVNLIDVKDSIKADEQAFCEVLVRLEEDDLKKLGNTIDNRISNTVLKDVFKKASVYKSIEDIIFTQAVSPHYFLSARFVLKLFDVNDLDSLVDFFRLIIFASYGVTLEEDVYAAYEYLVRRLDSSCHKKSVKIKVAEDCANLFPGFVKVRAKTYMAEVFNLGGEILNEIKRELKQHYNSVSEGTKRNIASLLINKLENPSALQIIEVLRSITPNKQELKDMLEEFAETCARNNIIDDTIKFGNKLIDLKIDPEGELHEIVFEPVLWNLTTDPKNDQEVIEIAKKCKKLPPELLERVKAAERRVSNNPLLKGFDAIKQKFFQ